MRIEIPQSVLLCTSSTAEERERETGSFRQFLDLVWIKRRGESVWFVVSSVLRVKQQLGEYNNYFCVVRYRESGIEIVLDVVIGCDKKCGSGRTLLLLFIVPVLWYFADWKYVANGDCVRPFWYKSLSFRHRRRS